VHISNPEAREAYRHASKVAPACVAKVSGFGTDSYILALEGLVRWLARRK
jgi:3-dehydroquinate dehydratase-2